MTTQLGRLLANDISDSTDFPDAVTAPGLRGLDDALRCDICRDFYDAPVSLNCGHSFCSVCIRSALPVSPTCPTCRKEASEVNLRKNASVERAVAAWRTARPLILRLSNEEHARKTRVETRNTDQSHYDGPARKRKRSGSPPSASDEEAVLVSSPAPSGSTTPNALPETVDCPICQQAVPSKKINMHIDSNCKKYLAQTTTRAAPTDTKGKQKQQWSQLLGNGAPSTASATKGKGKGKGKSRAKDEDGAEPEHLPKVAYDIHPQKRIVELLNEWGLSTQGDKNALIKRHSKWIVLYNANVDRAPENRHTVEQLRAELRRAEEAEQKNRKKETVDDPVAYQKANKAAFARLTEAARPKKVARPDRPSEETSTPSASSPPTGECAVKEETPHEVVEVDSD